MKILVVDDAKVITELLTDMLTSRHHVVEAVNDPKLALRVFREAAGLNQPFDVVLTDFNMPGWSGLTLALYIANCCRANNIKVPVICITGNGDSVRQMNERDGKPLAMILDKGCKLEDIHAAIAQVTA